MPLTAIPYQPLGFNPVRPTDCFSCDEREYCLPYIDGDSVMAQFIQTPCDPSITCDGDFTSLSAGDEVLPDGNFNEVGSELIVNGTFTGNANNWVLGTGWAYNSNNIRKTAGVATSARQILSSLTISDGIYKVTYTVSNRTAGTLTPTLNTGLTNYSGAASSSNATFTTYIKAFLACDTFLLTASSAFDGDIDNVSIKRVAATWSFGGTSTVGWDIEDSTGYAITIAAGAYGNCSGCGLICAGVVQPLTNYTVVIHIQDGSGTIVCNVGGNNSVYYTLTGGAQTINITITSGAGTDFYIAPGVSSKIKVSDISLIEVADDCWDFDANLWNITTNALCKIAGTSDTLTNAAVLLISERYQIKVTITGRTAGFISLNVAGISGGQIDDNGTFTQYFTPAATSALSIYASSLFDGCILNVEIFTLRNNYVFELRDRAGTLISTLSDHDGNEYGRVIYSENYVTLSFKFDTTLDDNDHALVPGCYYIYAYDRCEVQYDEIIVDGGFSNPMGIYWMDTSGAGATVTGNEMVITKVGIGSLNATIANLYLGTDGSGNYQDNPAILSGAHNYRVSFDVTVNDDPANMTVNILGGYQVPNPKPFLQGATPVGSYTADISFNPNYQDPQRAWFGIVAEFINTSGTIQIDNVSVRRIEPFDVTYISQCIEYVTDAECTKYIQGYCFADNLGFKFYDDALTTYIFKLAQRIYIRAINPVGAEENDDYLYSEGTKSRNFSQVAKVYNIITEHISESCIDALRMARNCEHFEIGEPTGTFTEWLAISGDLVPIWNKSGESKLAPCSFNVQLKDTDVKFFRNT